MNVKNKIQLITYPDSLGGSLKVLNHILQNSLKGIFEGGIHILPPFPSSGDRGFAPLTYLEIDPRFGTWQDIQEISQHTDIMVDLMVNHISKQSVWFQDFLKKGMQSDYADLFITLDKLWSDGQPKSEDLSKIFLRRSTPFSTFTIEDTGRQETVWTTFGKQEPSEQIDLDVNSDATKRLLTKFMTHFSRMNVKYVRLDAVGYTIKKPGTSCFFVKPEIFDFMEWINRLAASLNITLLPEVHSSYHTQHELAEKGYWIYDFILPFLILEALITHKSTRLINYLITRKRNQFTMLDCHDGIPVKPDLDGLISTADARRIVDVCVQRGSNLSRIFSDKHKGEDGFDVHQIRCSYYSVLNCNDNAYLTARAVQFFTPGIPQVYYVGLLAGENDIEQVEHTGEGREINRHNFTLKEIDEAVQKPVVKRLLRLIRFRNQHPAFEGEFFVNDTIEGLEMAWVKGRSRCVLDVNLETSQSVITYTDEQEELITCEI
ncbi:MAG: sucrose phosphorylase [Bacteroidales bacterium]|nr:sucrose phosphorylase [Bacteroidales bacterium]